MIDLIITPDDVSRVADWVELNVVFYSIPFSKAKLISLLNENGYEEGEYKGDALFDSIIQEIERRHFLYGVDPPYEIDNNIIRPLKNWKECAEYVLCLWFSYRGADSAHSGTKLFERVSGEAVKNYIEGECTVFGFPTDKTLKQYIDLMATCLFENRGGTDPDPHDKDRGVDVIAWKPFNDDRCGQIIILMQCAAGRRWRTKKSIPLQQWAQFIHWNYLIPIPSISITEVLDDSEWKKQVNDYGIIFDRARIFRNLYRGQPRGDKGLQNEIIDWCEQTVN